MNQRSARSWRIRVWSWNPRTDDLLWSDRPSVKHLLNSSEPAGSLEDFLRTVHPDDRAGLRKSLADTAADACDIAVEIRRTGADGLTRWLALEGRAILDEDGNIEHVAGVAMDITHVLETSRQLQERHNLLATTLHSIGDAVLTTDQNGRVTFLNPIAEQLSGWTNEEARGLPSEEVFVIVNEETRIKVDSPVHKVLRDGIIVGLANHTVLIAKDGRELPIDDSGAPIKDEYGNLLGTVLVFRDVTERRRTHLALQRLAAIIQSSDDAIVSKDLNGIVTSWNKAAERIYGYSAEEMIGKSKARVIPPDLPNELTNILNRVRAGERIEHYETSRIRKDGARIELSITVSPILDRDGRVVGASTIARDVTEQKRAERAMRESENRLTAILQSAMDAIITVDEDQKIIFFNASAERIFGTHAHTALGQPIERFIPERFRPGHSRHIRRFSDTGTTMRSMGELGALQGLRANGEEFPIEASISQTEVDGKKIFTVILRDITERQRAEEARLKHQIEVETLNEQLRRSMKETHHRVRNSLQLIAALTDIQRMEGGKTVPVDDLIRIESQVHALAAVHDILTREAGERGHANELSAREVLERLIGLFRAATPGRTIRADLDDARISAKQGSSLAVVANELVTNAVKHSAGDVIVSFRREGHAAILEVVDQGVGFPECFDPDEAQGTGLALIRHIARWDLGGAIEFGKRAEGGGRAALRIPLGVEN